MNTPGSMIIAIVSILVVVGLVLVATTSMTGREGAFGFGHIKRQLFALVLGVMAMAALTFIDYHLVARAAPWMLAASVLMLVAVLIPGIGMYHGGAQRWIRFVGTGIQPSEVAKIAVVLFVALWLSRNAHKVRTFTGGLLPVLIVAGLVGVLIAVEPDLGTSSLIIAVALVMAVMAGVRMMHLLPIMAPGAAGFACVVWAMRSGRILAFLDPWAYYHTRAGYHLCQSLVALGSGGAFGMGLGQSRQKLGFLPEIKNDFIFAILGEEMGLIGTLAVLVLFGLFVWFGMRVAAKSRDLLGYLIAIGVTLTIGLQALINMAVVTGSIPTKGIALPFVSLGGSSLVILLASVGVLLSVARRSGAIEPAEIPADTGLADA